MSRRRHALLVVLVSLAGLAAGCEDNPVGRICDLGAATPQAGEAVVASPSLDCVSRTCLRVPPSREPPPGSDVSTLTPNQGLCTAECSRDDECDRVPESPCLTGFTCGIPDGVSVGAFCCRKLCICRDFIVVPESGLGTPLACEADNKENKCCNLAGRRDNPMYPACRS
jgi:hypothetical protein